MPRLYSFLPLSAAVTLASGIASSANAPSGIPSYFSGEPTISLSSHAEDRSYAPKIMSNKEKSHFISIFPRNASEPSSVDDLLHDADGRDTFQVAWGGVIRVGR